MSESGREADRRLARWSWVLWQIVKARLARFRFRPRSRALDLVPGGGLRTAQGDALREPPAAGEKIKGNLIATTDRRESHAQPELSSWSLMVRARLVEARTLGTWVFN